MLQQIQKELSKNKKFKFATLVENDIEQYNLLKQEYDELSANSKKKLSDAMQVFLLILASNKNDQLFIAYLILSLDYDKFENPVVKKIQGRFYSECNYLHKTVQYLLPLFNAKALDNHNDLIRLFKALLELGMHNSCRNLLAFVLEKYPENLSWKLDALNYQIKMALLNEDSDYQTLLNNLNYLHKRCIKSKYYVMLANNFYQLGEYNKAIETFDKSFVTFEFYSEMADSPHSMFDSSKCRETMDELIDILEEDDIKPFPIAGSLLGLHRDGKFMDHDKDADIGVFVSGYDEIFSMVSIICKHPKFTSPKMVNEPKKSQLWSVSVFDSERHTVVDLFFFHRESQKMFFGIYTPFLTLKWAFKSFELTRQTLAGKEYWLPENIEQHLIEMYGENWREPIEAWDSLLNCPNLTPDSQPVVIYYGLMRLWEALQKNKTKKAFNYYQTLTTRWEMRFSAEAKENIERLLELNETSK